MKKAFLLLIAVLALTGTIWFNVGASGNEMVNTTVYSEFFTNVKAGQNISAQFYNAVGDLQKLPCKAAEEPGFVSCQFSPEYAGQQVPVELTKNGVMYVSIVNVPTN